MKASTRSAEAPESAFLMSSHVLPVLVCGLYFDYQGLRGPLSEHNGHVCLALEILVIRNFEIPLF